MDQILNYVRRIYLKTGHLKSSNFTIRSIFLLSFLSVSILSVFLFYSITLHTISKNLDMNEYEELQRHSKVIQADIEGSCNRMYGLATDYSVWDEAFRKAEDRDTDFFKLNYNEWLPANLGIDLILVFDSDKNILTNYGPKPEDLRKNSWMSQAIQANLNTSYLDISETDQCGLIRLGDSLYSIGISPIMNQDYSGSSGGVVILGDRISPHYLAFLEEKYDYKISIGLDSKTIYGNLPKDKVEEYLQNGAQSTRQKDSYTLTSVILENPCNKPVADLIIGRSNQEYAQLYRSINQIMGIGSNILLITIVILSLLVSRYITRPLYIIQNKINAMMTSGHPERIEVEATSEVKTVVDAFNSLIETIHTKEEDIETKDRFIALISHEFKTPITIINAAIQTMSIVCKDEMTPKMEGYLSKINRNTLRQLRLVDNLLDITKIKAGQMKVNMKNVDIISMTREITESIRVYSQQKNIHLAFCSDLDRKVMQMDELIYERILLNLISNAIKFTPAEKSISVVLTDKYDFIQLEVIDTGIGIPEEKQELIFERFGQVDSSLSRHAEGTGIGLYLVKSFVTILGGEISLISREGYGSNFTVLLPAVLSPSGGNDPETDVRKVEYTASMEFSDIID